MSDNESVYCTELPKIIDDGTDNNYGEWKIRSYHKLREWGLLKYIEGPTSDPPFIPPLRQTLTCQSVDDNGNLSTTHVLGNDAEHQKALADAEPWLSGNNIALSRIVTALPSRQLHLVQNVLYAKQAWESLRSIYRPRNLLHAATIKHQIMTYRCTSDMDVAKWLNDMQRLYGCLCNLDVECMSDREFALAILDLMPQDDVWRYFVSSLRTKVHDCDRQGVPISSITFIADIRDEYWYRHKDDFNTASRVFSARFEAQKRSTNASKRPSPTDLVTPSTSPVVAAKRARGPNPSKANLPRVTKHKRKQRTAKDTPGARTVVQPRPITPNSSTILSIGQPRPTSTVHIQSVDNASQATSALTSDSQCHAWYTQIENGVTHTTLPHDNSCHPFTQPIELCLAVVRHHTTRVNN